MSKPEFFYLEQKRIKTLLPIGIEKRNIYAALIYYCNLDKKIPIPQEFHTFFNEKPEGYDRNWSLDEKIEFIKTTRHHFTISHLDSLMNIVHRKNIVTIKKSTPLKFEMNLDHTFIEEPLRVLFEKIMDSQKLTLDDYESNDPHNINVSNLEKYLNASNKRLLSEIVSLSLIHI